MMVRKLRFVLVLLLGAMLALPAVVSHAAAHVALDGSLLLVGGHEHDQVHDHSDDTATDLTGGQPDPETGGKHHNPLDHNHDPGNYLIPFAAVDRVVPGLVSAGLERQRNPVKSQPPVRPPRQIVIA